jgi:hypothetical protein
LKPFTRYQKSTKQIFDYLEIFDTQFNTFSLATVSRL